MDSTRTAGLDQQRHERGPGSRRYGTLDGRLSYLYATAFAQVGKTLTAQQKEKLSRMREFNPAEPKGRFLYSDPIDMPTIENTDHLSGMHGVQGK